MPNEHAAFATALLSAASVGWAMPTRARHYGKSNTVRTMTLPATLALNAIVVASAPASAQELPLIDWTSFAPRLEELASDKLGREVRFESVEIVEPSLTPLLRLRGVRVANTGWGKAENLLVVDEMRVRVDLLALTRSKIVVPELALVNPHVALERNATGETNWSFAALSGGDDDGSTPPLPVLGDLRVTGAELSYDDEAAGLQLAGTLTSLTGQMADQSTSLTGEGTLTGDALSLGFDGGGLDALRAGDQPYPLNLRLALGETEVKAEGHVTMRDLRHLSGVDLGFRIAGSTLATLGLGTLTVPETAPYTLEARLTFDSDGWRLGDAKATLGESRALGWAELDLKGERPMLRADILAPEFHAHDLLGGAGKEPMPESKAAGPLFPAVPVPTDWLHRSDAVVHVRAERPDFPGPPIELLDVRFTVRDGRLEANPLKIGMAGGTITGELALNDRGSTPSADADLAYEGIRLRQAFRGTRFADETTGTLRGQLYLLGVGNTVAELADSLRGHAAFVMDEGTMSGLLIEGIDLDVAEALALYTGSDVKVPIRCVAAGLEVEAGVARIRRLVVDTRDSVMRAQGLIDLGKEMLDVRVEGQGKDFSLLDPDAPVFVKGPLRQPELSVGRAALIPLIELGLQGDAPCRRLQQEVLSLGSKAPGD